MYVQRPSLVDFLMSSLETRQVVDLETIQLLGNRHLNFDSSPLKQEVSYQNSYPCLVHVRADPVKIYSGLIAPEERMAAI